MKLKTITLITALFFLVGITGCKNVEQPALPENSNQETVVIENNQNEKTEESGAETDEAEVKSEQDNERNIAYAEALQKIHDEQILPDGTKFEYMSTFGDIEDNSFAVEDVDEDGVDELIFIWGTDASAGMAEYVFGYDENNKTVFTKLMEYPGLEFYKGGVITAPWSHNQGNGEMWPYNIYEYDSAKSEYEFVGYVEGWNKEISETDYEGTAFPEDVDTENKGVVYRIKYSDEYNEEYYSQKDYDAFCEKIILNNEKLEPRYFSFWNTYIDKLRESKLNPVIKGKTVYPNEVNVKVDASNEATAIADGSDDFIENLSNGIYPVNIDVDSIFEGNDGEYSVYADIYLKETYDIVDMNTLEIGDGIDCNGIITEIESIENKNGAVIINGGIDEGGLDFVPIDEDNCYVFKGFDDIATYRKCGYASLGISKDGIITDKSDLEKPDGIQVKPEEFKDYVTENNKYMCIYNTLVTVENGEIVDMTINYMP